MRPRSAKRARSRALGRHPAERRGQDTEQERAGDLRRRQHNVRRAAEAPRRHHLQREQDAAAERDQRRPAEDRARRAHRDHDAGKAHDHRAQAFPADGLAKQEGRQGGDENRTREIERRDVRERQIRDRPKEEADFERRKHDAQDLQARARHCGEGGIALAVGQGGEHAKRGGAPDQQQFADRVGRDQPLSERVVQGKHEAAEKHQRDTRRERGFRARSAAMQGLRGHAARTVLDALWMLYDRRMAVIAMPHRHGRACPGHPRLCSEEDVDARHKAGHDQENGLQ